MELLDNRGEYAETPKLLTYHPQAMSADRIEGLGQVDEGQEEVAMLLLAFFLELACGRYHIDSSALCAEAALVFWEETLLRVLKEMIEQDTTQDLLGDGQE